MCLCVCVSLYQITRNTNLMKFRESFPSCSYRLGGYKVDKPSQQGSSIPMKMGNIQNILYGAFYGGFLLYLCTVHHAKTRQFWVNITQSTDYGGLQIIYQIVHNFLKKNLNGTRALSEETTVDIIIILLLLLRTQLIHIDTVHTTRKFFHLQHKFVDRHHLN